MKKKKVIPPKNILHFILLVGMLVLLIYSCSYPWAVGKAILIKKTVYAHNIQHLSLSLYLVAITSIMAFLYALVTSRLFGSGMSLLITGGLTILLSLHVWEKIKDNEVAFLGINPLKIVSTRLENGLLLFFIAGVVIVFTGLIYLGESFLRRGLRKKPKK
ncbi:hypothetical protein ACFL5I_00485 [Planctomycetota bacterium]